MMQAPGEVIDEVRLQLAPSAFYSAGRRLLFETIIELHDEGKPIDLIMLNTLLIDRNKLDYVGGPGEIALILSFAPSAAYVDHYVGIVREKALLRGILYAAEQARRMVMNAEDAESCLNQFETMALEVREKAGHSLEDIPIMRELVNDAIKRQEEAHERYRKGDTSGGGLSFGLKGLDDLTGGMHPGEMTVIAARPSMGKTAFAMNIVERLAVGENPRRVLVFSKEMPAGSLVDRIYCGRNRISMNRLRQGAYSQHHLDGFFATAKALMPAPVWIEDSSTPFEHIIAHARRMKRRKDVELVVIDYLQLLRCSTKFYSREQEVAYMSTSVKNMAKELKIPVIVLCQLNRESETQNRKPKVADLRESGSIEQDADRIILLSKDPDGVDDPSEPMASRILIVGKDRNGATGEVPCSFLRRAMQFQD
jgi:replicative DNA helicase